MHNRLPARTSLLLALALAVGPGAGCPTLPAEVCGLSTTDPRVADRHLTATRDGQPFDVEASYAPGASATIAAGPLTLALARDEEGSATDDLVARAVFPICVRVGERGERRGSAALDGAGAASDADHTGSVALLRDDWGLLVGRFQLQLVDAAGAVTTFTDGAFRLPTKP